MNEKIIVALIESRTINKGDGKCSVRREAEKSAEYYQKLVIMITRTVLLASLRNIL